MNKSRVIGTSLDAINNAEKDIGYTFPKSFSEWLLKNNGKTLNGLSIFPVFDSRDPRKTWDSISRHFKEDWKEWLENFSDENIDFSFLLPFSSFGTGDYFCFNYAKLGHAKEPVIVIWSHETGEVTEIADCFSEFVASRK